MNVLKMESLLTTAFEGGSNYWYVIKGVYKHPKYDSKELDLEQYATTAYCYILITDRFGDHKPIKLTKNKLNKAMKILKDNFPKRYRNIKNDNFDIIDADAFLQCAVFGDIIYG